MGTEILSSTVSDWLLWPGDVIQQWRVIQQIGKGGMGQVYAVEDLNGGLRFALKLFCAKTGEVAFFSQRFKDVGAALLQVSHEHIGKVLQQGRVEIDGLKYDFLIMTLVCVSALTKQVALLNPLSLMTALPPLPEEDFVTLSPEELLDAHQGIPLKLLEQIYQDISSGLRYIHAQGIIHGDIKPTNILLAAGGRARLVDFGLARIMAPALRADSYETTLTQGGQPVIKGTALYLPPEAFNGERFNEKSDLYAFGATMFFLYSGISYHNTAAVRMMIGDLAPVWKNRFQALLAADPALRTWPESPSEVLQGMIRGKILPVLAFASLLGCAIGGLIALWWAWRSPAQRPLPTPAPMPAPAPAPQTINNTYLTNNQTDITLNQSFVVKRFESASDKAISVAPGERALLEDWPFSDLPRLVLARNALLKVPLKGGLSWALLDCMLDRAATLRIVGPGKLAIQPKAQVGCAGTLALADRCDVDWNRFFSGNKPKVVTAADCYLQINTGTNSHDYDLWDSLDMSRGGTTHFPGTRLYLTKTYLLGNGARISGNLILKNNYFISTQGKATVSLDGGFLWKSLYLAAHQGATLELTGDRLMMYDYWRGGPIYITSQNQGSVILSAKICLPLSAFHIERGRLVLRTDMTQDLKTNWCGFKQCGDWTVYKGATILGNVKMTFSQERSLIIQKGAFIEPGEQGKGVLKVSHLRLDSGATIVANQDALIQADNLTIGTSVTIDCARAKPGALLSWQSLSGDMASIKLINLPKNMSSVYSTHAIVLKGNND